jgi:hypothetical protein
VEGGISSPTLGGLGTTCWERYVLGRFDFFSACRGAGRTRTPLFAAKARTVARARHDDFVIAVA